MLNPIIYRLKYRPRKASKEAIAADALNVRGLEAAKI
jgi:hypothetical protein